MLRWNAKTVTWRGVLNRLGLNTFSLWEVFQNPSPCDGFCSLKCSDLDFRKNVEFLNAEAQFWNASGFECGRYRTMLFQEGGIKRLIGNLNFDNICNVFGWEYLSIYTHVGRRYQRVKGAHLAALWGNHLLTSAVLADHVQASGENTTLFRSNRSLTTIWIQIRSPVFRH